MASLIDRHDNWVRPRVSNEKYGDTYMFVGANGTFLRTSNAEVIGQIVQRKTDFLKPIEGYKVVDIFGRSIISQEGAEWRRHRKVVGPSFSEKSNKLVFEESLRQAQSMMDSWSYNDMKVDDAAHDTATLSLHVICAAGFGVPQVVRLILILFRYSFKRGSRPRSFREPCPFVMCLSS